MTDKKRVVEFGEYSFESDDGEFWSAPKIKGKHHEPVEFMSYSAFRMVVSAVARIAELEDHAVELEETAMKQHEEGRKQGREEMRATAETLAKDAFERGKEEATAIHETRDQQKQYELGFTAGVNKWDEEVQKAFERGRREGEDKSLRDLAYLKANEAEALVAAKEHGYQEGFAAGAKAERAMISANTDYYISFSTGYEAGKSVGEAKKQEKENIHAARLTFEADAAIKAFEKAPTTENKVAMMTALRTLRFETLGF